MTNDVVAAVPASLTPLAAVGVVSSGTARKWLQAGRLPRAARQDPGRKIPIRHRPRRLTHKTRPRSTEKAAILFGGMTLFRASGPDARNQARHRHG